MNYIMTAVPTLNGIYLSEDKKELRCDMTISYIADGADKTQPSSVGCSIMLSMEGERSTMDAELQEKTIEWFQTTFNPK